jgi:hypothetical protein
MKTSIYLSQSLSNTNLSKANRKRRNIYLSTSTAIVIAFASVFFSRVLDSLGAPSVINFAHFAVVPFALGVALTKNKITDLHQRTIIYSIISCLLIFFTVILISAVLNNAGEINAILSFLLWGEPFLILVAVLCLPSNRELIDRLQRWLLYSFVFHTLLALIQNYILRLYENSGGPDNIQGVFYNSGAGHVVGASVALTFGIYWFVAGTRYPLWLRGAFGLATFWHMLLADAKQVLLSLMVGGVLLLLTKFKNLTQALKYIALTVLFGLALQWCIANLAAFDGFTTWMRPEIYGPQGEATLLKTASFRIIPTFYESNLNWLFGLGPGHTVDRLGGWMWREYWQLFGPLGATTHPASSSIWQAVGASWLGNQSSMFSPLFGWAAIWGDLGVVGLIAYSGLCVVVYLMVCIDDISKFMLFSVFAVGWVFSQMQEPGYMLTIAVLIGLNWHSHQLKRRPSNYKILHPPLNRIRNTRLQDK